MVWWYLRNAGTVGRRVGVKWEDGRVMSEQNPKPGRYQRSARGLVASLLVTGLAVLALVWLMGLFRAEPTTEPAPVDHVEAVRAVQAEGQRPVYPPTLPEGWIATGFEVEPGADASYGLKLLTEDGRFAGVSQSADDSVTALLRDHVDEDDTEISEIASYDAPSSSVAPVWEGYTDRGGDTAYAAELADATVLVYGSAPAEDLQEIIDRLTREPLAD